MSRLDLERRCVLLYLQKIYFLKRELKHYDTGKCGRSGLAGMRKAKYATDVQLGRVALVSILVKEVF